MRTMFKRGAAVLLTVLAFVAAFMALPSAALADHAGTLTTLGVTAFGAVGALKFPVIGVDYQSLFTAAGATNASVPEAIPWTFYDTQNLASLWASVNFFAATNANKGLSNIEQPNTISGDQYFVLYALTFDYLAGASQSNNVAAQQLDDLRIIMETEASWLDFFIAQKLYLRIPLRAMHSLGGYQAWVAGTPATAFLLNSAANMACDGGYWMDGSLILPPRQTFQAQINAGTPTAQTATRSCSLGMTGVLYRPVR